MMASTYCKCKEGYKCRWCIMRSMRSMRSRGFEGARADWLELAHRWTPKCPKCKSPLDCRTAQFGAENCDNPDCEDGKANLDRIREERAR